MASATLTTTPSALIPTKVIALPCSRKREKGRHAATSNQTTAATSSTYSGCAT